MVTGEAGQIEKLFENEVADFSFKNRYRDSDAPTREQLLHMVRWAYFNTYDESDNQFWKDILVAVSGAHNQSHSIEGLSDALSFAQANLELWG